MDAFTAILQAALLVYKFPHSGYPKIFVPFLKPRNTIYNTHKSQGVGVLFEVPYCATSVYKSTNDFWPQLLPMMLERFGMMCLMIYIWPLLSTRIQKEAQKYLFAQAYPP